MIPSNSLHRIYGTDGPFLHTVLAAISQNATCIFHLRAWAHCQVSSCKNVVCFSRCGDPSFIRARRACLLPVLSSIPEITLWLSGKCKLSPFSNCRIRLGHQHPIARMQYCRMKLKSQSKINTLLFSSFILFRARPVIGCGQLAQTFQLTARSSYAECTPHESPVLH